MGGGRVDASTGGRVRGEWGGGVAGRAGTKGQRSLSVGSARERVGRRGGGGRGPCWPGDRARPTPGPKERGSRRARAAEPSPAAAALARALLGEGGRWRRPRRTEDGRRLAGRFGLAGGGPTIRPAFSSSSSGASARRRWVERSVGRSRSGSGGDERRKQRGGVRRGVSLGCQSWLPLLAVWLARRSGPAPGRGERRRERAQGGAGEAQRAGARSPSLPGISDSGRAGGVASRPGVRPLSRPTRTHPPSKRPRQLPTQPPARHGFPPLDRRPPPPAPGRRRRPRPSRSRPPAPARPLACCPDAGPSPPPPFVRRRWPRPTRPSLSSASSAGSSRPRASRSSASPPPFSRACFTRVAPLASEGERERGGGEEVAARLRGVATEARAPRRAALEGALSLARSLAPSRTTWRSPPRRSSAVPPPPSPARADTLGRSLTDRRRSSPPSTPFIPPASTANGEGTLFKYTVATQNPSSMRKTDGAASLPSPPHERDASFASDDGRRPTDARPSLLAPPFHFVGDGPAPSALAAARLFNCSCSLARPPPRPPPRPHGACAPLRPGPSPSPLPGGPPPPAPRPLHPAPPAPLPGQGNLVWTADEDRTSSFYEIAGFNKAAETLEQQFQNVLPGFVPPPPRNLADACSLSLSLCCFVIPPPSPLFSES